MESTAWKARIDYKALINSADFRGARSKIRVAGYKHETICTDREGALAIAKEIEAATSVPMCVCETVIIIL